MLVYSSLKYKTSMKLDGFDSLWYNNIELKPEKLFHLSLNNDAFQKQYNLFKEKVINSINKTYLPVYRMSDGEFRFCLRKTTLKKKILSGLKFNNTYSTTCWGERYSKEEIGRAFPGFNESLIEISKQGFLALHFVQGAPLDKYRIYIEPMCNWFKRNAIELNEFNYISFYFVYALLSVKDSVELLRNKRILIITSNSNNKFKKIEKIFSSKYHPEILFYEILPDKSLLKKISYKLVDPNVDVVLISAGIGSVNIMIQLEGLKTVCLDTGIFLEMLVDNTLKTSRLF